MTQFFSVLWIIFLGVIFIDYKAAMLILYFLNSLNITVVLLISNSLESSNVLTFHDAKFIILLFLGI